MAASLREAVPVRTREPVNILLVDDQPGKLMSYEAILEPLGENLIKAGSGKEALEHLLRSQIGVVLIDVCMPDIDGFELASMIREHPRHQRTAIIFVSAVHLTDMDRLRGFECGAVDYVSVPVQPEILRARVGVFADLHRKTQQLEWLNRELERRVEERTAELTTAAECLRESEASLRESDQRKDEFLAMLAHELRNPLAPIRNAVELMRLDAAGGDEVRWIHEVIERQLAHLTRLVDDLLDVSRIRRGKLEIRPEAADIADIVRAAAEAIRPTMSARGLDLQVSLPPGPLPVRADVVRMTQVVLNLLDNACKFTPGGGTVRLAAEAVTDAVRVVVRDSGAGIHADELPHLFQMFYQSSMSRDPSQGGLGIGLALGHGPGQRVRGAAAAPRRHPPGGERAGRAHRQGCRVGADATDPRGGRQPGQRREPGGPAQARRQRGADGLRRDGRSVGGTVVPARRRAARHRTAGPRRLPGRARDPRAARGQGHHACCGDRLGPGAGPAALAGSGF